MRVSLTEIYRYDIGFNVVLCAVHFLSGRICGFAFSALFN